MAFEHIRIEGLFEIFLFFSSIFIEYVSFLSNITKRLQPKWHFENAAFLHYARWAYYVFNLLDEWLLQKYDSIGASTRFGGGATAASANVVSADVLVMKRRRQCSLEWEFIATILDRCFLIVFAATVLLVTLGMIVTGLVAQSHYERAVREAG